MIFCRSRVFAAFAVRSAAVLLALLLLGTAAQADSAVIGGKRMTCGAAKVVMDASLPGPGYSLPGVIMFNPRFLNAFTPITRRIVFLHECAHQYVGTDERQADCWAVRMAKRQGWFKESHIDEVCRSFWKSPGGLMHMAGPQRCSAMRSCFAAAPGGAPQTARHRSRSPS